jgi:exosortase
MSENADAGAVKSPAGAPPQPSFFQEAADIWNRLPHKYLFLTLLGAWIVLFHYYGNATLGYAATHSMFLWAHSVYIGPDDDQHGDYIPLLVLALLWIRRDRLAGPTQLWWPAAFYLAFAVLVQIAAYRIQQGRVSVLAFILGLHALIGMVWGRDAMRRSIFPIFVLLFCIPMGSLSAGITSALRIFVTKVCVGLTHDVLGIQVFRDGSQILDKNHLRPLYEVAPACSGIRSLVALAALSVVYSFLTFETFWRRALIILCSPLFAIGGNIIRVTTVIIVGDSFGQEAGAMIENKFGFVTFIFAIAMMMGLGWVIREKDPAAPEKPPSTPSPNTNLEPEKAV